MDDFRDEREGNRWIYVLEESGERKGTKSTGLSPPLSATCKSDKCITKCYRENPNIRRGLGKVTFQVPTPCVYDHYVQPFLWRHVAHEQMMADNVKNTFERA